MRKGLSKALKQKVVVENRSAASSAIAAEFVARSCQMGKENPDLGPGHLAGIARAVKKDGTSDPMDVRLLSAPALMAHRQWQAPGRAGGALNPTWSARPATIAGASASVY